MHVAFQASAAYSRVQRTVWLLVWMQVNHQLMNSFWASTANFWNLASALQDAAQGTSYKQTS